MVLATANVHKVNELTRVLQGRFARIQALTDLGLEAPEETGATFVANARLKALACARATGMPCLADDSGLEVAALDGRPGVGSARYAPDADQRIDKLLAELASTRSSDRRARFVSVVALARGDAVQTFRGQVSGVIVDERRGEGGFGYDPIFFIPRLKRTMAELAPDEKDAISHRGRALRRLLSRTPLSSCSSISACSSCCSSLRGSSPPNSKRCSTPPRTASSVSRRS
ncbi:MAG: RdgB/HAM1 family non-canonical purine NTP pyrophosphatase [Candidatus Riflebacteria bacterium]|nr:RdgB/HAM1 family non-canonical purine NTP pyrophosphatase [Candidatus Riflebacteria bacterium]